MFLLNLPFNVREQAAIERRRRQERERVSRIFNVKYRTIGVDRESLDEQVRDRQRRRDLEEQRNAAFDREMIRNDLQVIFLEQEALAQQRQKAQALNDYRRAHQRPEYSREWDLNNPDGWKYLTPARVRDDDERLGSSSAQIFAGEDLQRRARERAQQEQLREYFEVQRSTKAKRAEQERLADLLYGRGQLELYERDLAFEQAENECQRAMQLATRQFNEILASEAKARLQQRESQQNEERLAELANTAFSDLLTENASDVRDARGHILVDRWKGMTKDQLADIRHQQLAQIDERQKMAAAQGCVEEIWARHANAAAKQAAITAHALEEDTRRIRRQLDDANQHLARAQRDQQDFLNANVYRSAATAAFYEQFNTTSR